MSDTNRKCFAMYSPDVAQYILAKTKQAHSDSMILFIAYRQYKYATPHTWFPVSEFMETHYVSKCTAFRVLDALEDANLITRTYKYVNEPGETRKTRQVWVGIKDEYLIKELELDKIKQGQSETTLEEIAEAKETKLEFYEEFSDAVCSLSYDKALAQADKIPTYMIQPIFIYGTLFKQNFPDLRIKWNSQTYGIFKTFIDDYTVDGHEPFDYAGFIGFTNYCRNYSIKHFGVNEVPKEMGNPKILVAYYRQFLDTRREVPPYISFEQIYKKLLDKEAPMRYDSNILEM